jgi:hypothetical protein
MKITASVDRLETRLSQDNQTSDLLKSASSAVAFAVGFVALSRLIFGDKINTARPALTGILSGVSFAKHKEIRSTWRKTVKAVCNGPRYVKRNIMRAAETIQEETTAATNTFKKTARLLTQCPLSIPQRTTRLIARLLGITKSRAVDCLRTGGTVLRKASASRAAFHCRSCRYPS